MQLSGKLRQLDIVLIIVIIACVAIAYGLYLDLREENYTNLSLQTGWQYSWIPDQPSILTGFRNTEVATKWQDISLPGAPPLEKGKKTIWYRIRLPENTWPEASILFRSKQQTVKVYLEDTLIYSFAESLPADGKSVPGSFWNIVKLPPNYEGKTLYIELYSPFSQFAGFLGMAKIGCQSALTLEQIDKHLFSIILGCIFIFIGLASLVVYYFGKRFEDALQGLGFSAFFTGIWTIAESKIVEFFYFAPLLRMYVAYTAIYLVPVGYCILFARFFREGQSAFYQKLKLVFLSFAIVSLTLEYTHLVSIFHTVYVFFFLLIVSMAITIVFCVQAALQGNKEAVAFTLGFAFLFSTGIYDLITLHYPKVLFTEQRMTQWGMLVFVLLTSSIIGRRLKVLYETMAENFQTNRMNYQSLFANMIDACIYCQIIADNNGRPQDLRIMDANKAFYESWGIGEGELQDRRMSELIPHAYQNNWNILLEYLAADLQKIELEDPFQVGKRWCKVSAFCPIQGYVCVIMEDVTAKKEAEELIWYQAYHDSVTGLPNRRFFEQEIERIEKEGMQLTSLISVDLDGLKIVNDTLGHTMGDLLLKEAAGILRSAVGQGQYVTRIGGDEFAIILPGLDNQAALEVVARITKAMEDYNSKRPMIPLSMSMGVATFNQELDRNLLDVYQRADDNMYQYKLGQVHSGKSGVIDMLLTALEKKDYTSEGHVERLTQMAEKMAEKLNLTANETKRLVLLAKMHDLGKIGIPDDILFKPGKLTESECNKLKEHPQIGYSIASRINELVPIAPLILHHHENWDGSGYPYGLRGKEIPMECRILSIIDAYYAMTSARPYGRSLTREEAVRELQKYAGTQFDPGFVQVFIETLAEDAEPRNTVSY